MLQLATIEAARQLGLEHRLGSVTVGKDAHLVLVDGDPVADIRALYRARLTIKGQALFEVSELLEAEGVAPP